MANSNPLPTPSNLLQVDASRRLRVIGLLEGLSFLLLLGVMPLKYMAGMPGPVRVVGLIHGILFIFYLLYVMQDRMEYRWPRRVTMWALVASLLPLGPIFVERYLFRRTEK